MKRGGVLLGVSGFWSLLWVVLLQDVAGTNCRRMRQILVA